MKAGTDNRATKEQLPSATETASDSAKTQTTAETEEEKMEVEAASASPRAKAEEKKSDMPAETQRSSSAPQIAAKFCGDIRQNPEYRQSSNGRWYRKDDLQRQKEQELQEQRERQRERDQRAARERASRESGYDRERRRRRRRCFCNARFSRASRRRNILARSWARRRESKSHLVQHC